VNEKMDFKKQISLRKTIGIFTVAILFLGMFDLIFIAKTTSGTTSSIFMQNGSINFSGNLTYNGNNQTDLIADPQTSTYSYTWTLENNAYIARNSSGRILYSGTDLYTVVNNTVNSAPTGSSFSFGAGNFQLNGTIPCVKPMDIDGQGQGVTTLTMMASAYGLNMFNVTANSVSINKMTIEGNDSALNCIFISSSAGHASLSDLGIYDAVQDNLHVDGGSGYKIDRVYAYSASRFALYWNGVDSEIDSLTIGSSPSGKQQVGFYCIAGGGTKVTNFHIWGNMNGVELGDVGNSASRIYFDTGGINDNQRNAVIVNGSGAYDFSFENTEFRENGDEVGYYGTYDAIRGVTGAAFQGAVISNNNFMGQGSRNLGNGTQAYNLTRYAINLTGASKSNIVIQGNTINSNTFAGKVNNYSPLIVGIYMIDGCEVSGNVGEVWEAWGADTFAGNTTSMYMNLTQDYGLIGPVKSFNFMWETAPQGRTMYFTENQTMVHLWLIYANNGSTASCTANLVFSWSSKYYP
jgi:hypothetical protein